MSRLQEYVRWLGFVLLGIGAFGWFTGIFLSPVYLEGIPHIRFIFFIVTIIFPFWGIGFIVIAKEGARVKNVKI